MIKAFVFDWGHVLEDPHHGEFIEEMAAFYGAEEEQFREVERTARHAMDAGKFDESEYVAQVSHAIGIHIDEGHFLERKMSYFEVNEKLLALIRNLKGKYKLMVLSNCHPPMIEHMKKNTDFEEIFDKMEFSFEDKLVKPDPKFYHKVLEGTGLKPEDCVYLDDREDLVKVGNDLGFHSFVYTTVEKFIEDVKGLGIELN